METHGMLMDRLKDPEHLTFPPRFNVAVPFIDRHMHEGRGDKAAIRTAQGDVTYAALAANVNRAANGLTDLGLAPGDRVMIVVKDCPTFFYAFWGAVKAGFVPIPVNTLLRFDTYAFMLEDSKASVAIYSPEYAAEVGRALEASSHKPRHVLLTEDAPGSFEQLLAGSGTHFEPVTASAESDCFWLYSSGSTGRPKGTVHRHRDMVVTSQFFGVETLGMREDDICYSEAKLFFAYGLGNNLTFPLWVGATSVLNPDRPGPETSFPVLARFRPTMYFDPLCCLSRQHGEGETRPLQCALLRLGGRGAAGRHPPALARGDGSLDHRRNRVDRGSSHFHKQSSRRR
jgi:acyl-coenzyme A synthetase/AMP-(fatty) acid ligase